MKGASLKYLTKEGFRNVWVNRLMSLASVSVLMACLVIIGLGAMIFFNIDALLDTIERQNVVMVYVAVEATDEQTSQLGNQLKTMIIFQIAFLYQKKMLLKPKKKQWVMMQLYLKDLTKIHYLMLIRLR